VKAVEEEKYQEMGAEQLEKLRAERAERARAGAPTPPSPSPTPDPVYTRQVLQPVEKMEDLMVPALILQMTVIGRRSLSSLSISPCLMSQLLPSSPSQLPPPPQAHQLVTLQERYLSPILSSTTQEQGPILHQDHPHLHQCFQLPPPLLLHMVSTNHLCIPDQVIMEAMLLLIKVKMHLLEVYPVVLCEDLLVI